MRVTNKYLKRMTLHVLLQVSWFFETCTTFSTGIGLLSLLFLIVMNFLPFHLLLNGVKKSKVNPEILQINFRGKFLPQI